MPTNELPPEIWSHILCKVPHVEQIKLLQVSHAFHDIAISLVFAVVKIYFVGGNAAYAMLNTKHEDFKEEVTTKLMTRSYELLRHMVREPSFACVVKSLTVITSSDSESTFEQLFLADALAVLPNLQTFRWFGTNPGITDAVTESLPVNLERLVLKTYVPSPNILHRFQGVTELGLPTPFFYPDDEEAHDDATASSALLDITASFNFGGTMNSMSLDRLKSLTLNAVHLAGLPIKILETLTELDICVTTALHGAGLDLILRHATILESLTIFGYVDQDVFSWLACEASDLPALRSFRLSFDRFGMFQPPAAQDLNLLVKFLADRPTMRRLYLRIPTIDFSELTALAPVVRNMKSLEAFGLHTGAVVVDDWFIPFVVGILPASIRALHLAIDWNGTNILLLIDCLYQYPLLTFFHLYGINSRLPLDSSDVAAAALDLTLFGRNRALWNVRRGKTLELDKWPRWKIKFCTEDDFEDPDHFWLFEYN